MSDPMATMMLAYQGAQIIKTERANDDYVRPLATRRGGFSSSVLVDLDNPAGVQRIIRPFQAAAVPDELNARLAPK